MKIIRSAFCLQLNLCPGGTSDVGARVCRSDSELFDGVQSGTQGALKRCAQRLIIVVDSVQGKVRLVAAAAVHGTAAAVAGEVDLIAVCDGDHSRLQAQDRSRIAALKWQRRNLCLIERVSNRRIGRIDRLRRADHFHCRSDTRQLHCEIVRGWSCHQQLQIDLFVSCEAGRFRCKRVGRRPHFQKLIGAVFVGLRRERNANVRTRERKRRIRYGRSPLVRDHATH